MHVLVVSMRSLAPALCSLVEIMPSYKGLANRSSGLLSKLLARGRYFRRASTPAFGNRLRRQTVRPPSLHAMASPPVGYSTRRVDAKRNHKMTDLARAMVEHD